MLEKYTTDVSINGMHAIFVLNSLESKSLFGSMLEKYSKVEHSTVSTVQYISAVCVFIPAHEWERSTFFGNHRD